MSGGELCQYYYITILLLQPSIDENVLDNLLNNRYFPSLTAAESQSNQDKDVRTMCARLLIVELLHLLASVNNKA